MYSRCVPAMFLDSWWEKMKPEREREREREAVTSLDDDWRLRE